MKNIPHFFKDNSENPDHEIMLDYFLGWTLRCSISKNPNEKLRIASKEILSYLLFKKHKEFEVESVLTWKQWKKIDLCAEIILKRNGITEKYAILFENKMYTHIHSNQLERYKDIFESYYNDVENEKTDYMRKYIFLTCLYEEINYESDKLECERTKFDFHSFDWLKSQTAISETGNYMFDEFWFRYWK